MKNKTFLKTFSNPLGITFYLIIGFAMLLGSINRFVLNEIVLGLTSLIGSFGFLSIAIYLLFTYRNSKK